MSLSDFDNNSIDDLPSFCKNVIPAIEEDATNSIEAKDSVSEASISSTSASRLIAAVNAAKNFGSISRVVSPQNMGYESVLAAFKI